MAMARTQAIKGICQPRKRRERAGHALEFEQPLINFAKARKSADEESAANPQFFELSFCADGPSVTVVTHKCSFACHSARRSR